MRMRPKLICWPLAGRPSELAKAASTAVTSRAFSPPPESMDESADDRNASSGKLSGKDTGLVGSGMSPMTQLASFGFRQSSSRTALVSRYHNGKPLLSSIGPTCFSPTAFPLWTGGGVAAEAMAAPEAARVSATAPATAAGACVRAFLGVHTYIVADPA